VVIEPVSASLPVKVRLAHELKIDSGENSFDSRIDNTPPKPLPSRGRPWLQQGLETLAKNTSAQTLFQQLEIEVLIGVSGNPIFTATLLTGQWCHRA
jgi:hypothetical protein